MHLVLFYVVVLVLAVGVVKLTDGTYLRLAETPFSRGWLLAVGLGLQILLATLDLPTARLKDVGIATLLLSYVAILGFCATNLRTRGIAVIGLGVALNALVIALNVGMPYTVVDGLPRETTIKHRPERKTDILPVLSDRFAYGSPFNAAISIGDLVLGVGIVELAYANSRRIRRRRGSDAARFVDLPALEREQVIDVREAQPAVAPAGETSDGATIASNASSTRGSYTKPGPE